MGQAVGAARSGIIRDIEENVALMKVPERNKPTWKKYSQKRC